MKIITLLTDFGTKSGYVSQMKGVIYSLSKAIIIDITHDVNRHDVKEGAFILKSSVPYFPNGSIHVAVVDPEVGTDRRSIIIKTKNHILIGPDNGLLIPIANLLGDFTVYNITNKRYMLKKISNTFNGRDIFAPISAHIVNGVSIEKLGERINDYVKLDFGKYRIAKKTALGQVIHIDRFGNIITNIDGDELKNFVDYNKNIILLIREKEYNIPFVKSYGYVKENKYLATIGGSNLFEICINKGNASEFFNIKNCEEIRIWY